MTRAAYRDESLMVVQGDVIDALSRLRPESVQTCVTSPPYWGLRNYGMNEQFGSESTLNGYVVNMLHVFRRVREVLKPDGTLWLNLGDTYKDKQLMGVPWRVALELQSEGWYLRNEIIWHKPNAMPETTRDRLTRDHETIFLFAKSDSYYYDLDAIRVKTGNEPTEEEYRELRAQRGDYLGKKSGFENDRGTGKAGKRAGALTHPRGRNRRTVWSVPTQPYKGSHVAVFPPSLIEPCILAGAPEGGTVLDPFAGSGTTLMVARQHNRRAIGIELNPEYVPLILERCGISARPDVTQGAISA